MSPKTALSPALRFRAFVHQIKTELNSRNLHSVIFGHAGDGNVHIDVLKYDIPYDAWKLMLPELKKKIYEIAIAQWRNNQRRTRYRVYPAELHEPCIQRGGTQPDATHQNSI